MTDNNVHILMQTLVVHVWLGITSISIFSNFDKWIFYSCLYPKKLKLKMGSVTVFKFVSVLHIIHIYIYNKTIYTVYILREYTWSSLWMKNLKDFFFLLTLSPLLNKVDEMSENIRMKAAICYNARKLFSLPPWLIRLMCASMTLTIFNKCTWIGRELYFRQNIIAIKTFGG